jgi:hypothetical protein
MYGALFGLGTMGGQVVRLLVLPNVGFVGESCKADMNGGEGEESEVLMMESKRCFEALVVMILPIVKVDLADAVAGAKIADRGLDLGGSGGEEKAYGILRSGYGGFVADALFVKMGNAVPVGVVDMVE